jgi:hypothetical protein
VGGRSWIPWLVLLVAGAGSPVAGQQPAASPSASELNAAVRGLIEPGFRKNTGIGFARFECNASAPVQPGDLFDCDAVDQEGDSLRYTLGVDEEGTARVVLVSQPASQLTAAERAALEPPCHAFLGAYAAGQWDALYTALHPSLRETATLEALRAQLEPVRASLGALRGVELRRYARHVSGRHELEYALSAESGRGVARFGVALDDAGARLTAFNVSAEPGTPLQKALLEASLRGMVSGLVGEPVTRVEAPLDRLVRVGDAVLGKAHLAAGGDMPIRVSQKGRKDDFDTIDYACQVLDAPWLIRRLFVTQSKPVASVDCPKRVVPDGGGLTCEVKLESGERLAATVTRRGGDHRVTSIEPIEP